MSPASKVAGITYDLTDRNGVEDVCPQPRFDVVPHLCGIPGATRRPGTAVKLLSDCTLQRRTSGQLNAVASWDLDFFAGARVATGASCTLNALN